MTAAPRVFPPLEADHPAVGRLCPACGEPLEAGEITTLIDTGLPEDHTVEAAVVHVECYDHLALLDAMVKELRDREAPLTLVLRPDMAVQLAALLQLARVHPAIGETHAATATVVIEHVRGFFADAPAILEVLKLGDVREPW